MRTHLVWYSRMLGKVLIWKLNGSNYCVYALKLAKHMLCALVTFINEMFLHHCVFFNILECLGVYACDMIRKMAFLDVTSSVLLYHQYMTFINCTSLLVHSVDVETCFVKQLN